MKSKWEHLKVKAIELRKNGNSIRSIRDELGIPLSTLSGWLRNIQLTSEQEQILYEKWKIGLSNARIKAVEWHNAGKAERLLKAKSEANFILKDIQTDNHSLELALAFLYLGEGGKGDQTCLGSSDSNIASFFITSILYLYKIPIEKIKCYLHLRVDQDEISLKQFWSVELGVPLENFGKTSFDKRTVGKPTYNDYKGVCLIECGRVEIQRRLMYIATGYCDKVSNEILRG